MVNKILLISGLKWAMNCRRWRKFSSKEEQWAPTLISNSSLATLLPSKNKNTKLSLPPCLEPPTDKKQILVNEQHQGRFQLYNLHVAWTNIAAKWSFTNVRCDAQVPRLGCRNNKESGIQLIHILPADGGVIYSTCNLHRSALQSVSRSKTNYLQLVFSKCFSTCGATKQVIYNNASSLRLLRIEMIGIQGRVSFCQLLPLSLPSWTAEAVKNVSLAFISG